MGTKITSTKTGTSTRTAAAQTANPGKLATLVCQEEASIRRIAIALSMPPARVLAFGVDAPENKKDVLRAFLAPMTPRNFGVDGQALVTVDGKEKMDSFTRIQLFDFRGKARLFLATEDFAALLERLRNDGIPFEGAALAEIANAVRANGRTSEVFLTNSLEDFRAYVQYEGGQIAEVLLANDEYAGVACLSHDDGQFIATITDEGFEVTHVSCAGNPDASRYKKAFPYGLLDYITPAASDGYHTATYEREGQLWARRLTPFTMTDSVEFAPDHDEFPTPGRILRDAPGKATLIQLPVSDKAPDQLGRAQLWLAEYARAEQPAPDGSGYRSGAAEATAEVEAERDDS